MRIYRNFKCKDKECGHIQEMFLDNSIAEVDCNECGDVSGKMLSMPRAQSNTVGKNPAYQKSK